MAAQHKQTRRLNHVGLALVQTSGYKRARNSAPVLIPRTGF